MTRALRDEIVLHYLPMVRTQARVMCRRNSAVYDDLFGYGVIGLINAVDTYDPGYGKRSRFETYAENKIRWAIRDGWRRMDAVNRMCRTQARRGIRELPVFVSEEKLRHIPAPAQDFDCEIESDQLRSLVANAMGKLPPRERKAAYLYFFKNVQMKTIGRRMGVNESRVSQIITAAKIRLRKLCRAA